MTENAVYDLKTSLVFSKLIQPLRRSSFRRLKQNLVKNGCVDPIPVWHMFVLEDFEEAAQSILLGQVKISQNVLYVFIHGNPSSVCSSDLLRCVMLQQTTPIMNPIIITPALTAVGAGIHCLLPPVDATD